MLVHLLLAILTGWLQRHQQRVITYVHEENRVLKVQLRAAKSGLERHRGRIIHRGRLGGLLSYYYREAASRGVVVQWYLGKATLTQFRS
jgi:hypothetical protein